MNQMNQMNQPSFTATDERRMKNSVVIWTCRLVDEESEDSLVIGNR